LKIFGKSSKIAKKNFTKGAQILLFLSFSNNDFSILFVEFFFIFINFCPQKKTEKKVEFLDKK